MMYFMLSLNLLWLLPIFTFRWARRHAPAKLWRFTGFVFGAVVNPAAMGLYGLYFLGPITALLGILGLVLTMFHGDPGYNLAIQFGLVKPRTVVVGIQHFYIALLDGVVWSIIYGVSGWIVDWFRARIKLNGLK